MDIRILEKNDEQNKVSFILRATNNTFANMLRRYIIEKVPTMAMEEIEFKDNSSVLYDEIIAHRLGLVPLKTDLKSYVKISECKCKGEGCNRCTLKITMKVQGPQTALASELKSKDPKVTAVYQKMPIVKLLKDQKLEFIATAVLGTGDDHVKFSPGVANFRLKPDIKITKNPANSEAVAESCSVKVFESKNNNLSIDKDNLMKCHLCNHCIEIAQPKGSLELIQGPDIILNVESFGQLKCKEMIQTAFSEFNNDLSEFEELLKKE